MTEIKFTENFEKITQTYHYVGITRSKDVRLFNFQASEESIATSMVGISNIVNYFEIENSVDQAFRVGRISIKDNIDARYILPLIGNEIIYIEYNAITEAKSSLALVKKGFFRVMSIENTTDSQLKSSGLVFTDRELIFTIAEYPYVDLLTFNSYNKTYKWNGGSDVLPPQGATSIGGLVSDMFNDPTTRETITTMGITYNGMPTADRLPESWLNYYSPNWSKLKNINFLKRFAVSLIGRYPYYYLNCESDKITFKSIYYEFLNDQTRVLNSIDLIPIDYMGLSSTDMAPPNIANVLMDVNYKIGNGLSALFSGYSGSTNFSFDYLSGHVFSVYDYRRFRKSITSSESFYINFQNHGHGHLKMDYSPFTDPLLNDNLQIYDFAKKSFNSMICEATTFITKARYLGQVVNIATPNAGSLNTTKLDPVYGKNWCIWGYKDIVCAQRGICKLTLKKDTTNIKDGGLYGSMIAI
jgi:hypothetical protein